MLLVMLCLALTGSPVVFSPPEEAEIHIQKASATLKEIERLLDSIQNRQHPPARERTSEKVETSHWAYAICQHLQQHNLLPGYNDTVFAGKSLLSRGEFAAATNCALNTYWQATAGPPADLVPMRPAPPMTLAQMDMVSRLFQEFYYELPALGVNRKDVQRRLVERRRERIAIADQRFVMAARRGDLPILKSELDAGVPADGPVYEGRNALQAAVSSDDEAAVHLLLERGANPRNGLPAAQARLLKKVLKIIQEAIAKEHSLP